jgi:phosphoribosylformimino-5-aminoimidazole carboxamide ribotide isomerase
MIVIPAMDLRSGSCVQLTDNAYARERLRLRDVFGAARAWTDFGFSRLHITDMDAEIDGGSPGDEGRGNNESLIRDLLTECEVEVQVGGGTEHANKIHRLRSVGATNIVLGPRAMDDPHWVDDMASDHPGELIVTLEIRNRRVVSRARSLVLDRDVLDATEALNDLPLAAILLTGSRDILLMEDVAEIAQHPLMVSEEARTMHELRSLEDAGIAAVIVGNPLFNGVLDPQMIAEEFAG